MVPRETRVHVFVVLATIVVFAVGANVVDSAPQWAQLLGAAVLYGLLFGGAHLYLALRGESGEVPLPVRWRFLAFLAVMIVLGMAAAVADDAAVGPVALKSAAFWAMGAAVLAYFVGEGLASYRESRP